MFLLPRCFVSVIQRMCVRARARVQAHAAWPCCVGSPANSTGHLPGACPPGGGLAAAAATARAAAASGRARDSRSGRLGLHLRRLGDAEEGVRDGVEGADALGGIVLEHLHDEVLQLEVVGHRVARLTQPPPVRPARLDAEHVVERSRLAVAWMSQHVRARLVALAEVLEALGARLDHPRRRRPQKLLDGRELISLVLSGKERLARVQLDEHAAEAPHVDGHVVAAAEQHLGRAVEARLDVRVHRLPVAAARAKVDQLDRRALRMSEQDVLRLEVAVDDRDVSQLQEAECLHDLLAELAHKVERDALEVRVPQQVVQVVRQHLKDEALVAAEQKVVEQAHDARRVARILLVEELQQLDLRLGLLQEGLLTLDDLDRHRLRPILVVRLDDLPKRPLADDRAHDEALVE
mmetsp:Transcript_29698/g.76867  ORF Transcript_29698/g.76867 Transcript_29698/m.76867 type:complete len:407 (+) Transcript_29698:332-1552(+)